MSVCTISSISGHDPFRQEFDVLPAASTQIHAPLSGEDVAQLADEVSTLVDGQEDSATDDGSPSAVRRSPRKLSQPRV